MKTFLSIFVFFSYFCANAQNSQDTLSIYFDFNSSSLTSEAKETLDTFNSSEHGPILSVVAHCDTSGTKNYNLKLAQQRLDVVLAEVDSTAKSTIAQGEKISSKAKNYDAAYFRRVDIISTGSMSEDATLTEVFDEFFNDSDLKRVNIDMTILFYEGESRMTPESVPEVEELYKLMKLNPTINVHIHGHVCCGNNYILSKNRAYAVYMYLLSRKISGKRMKYTGHSNSIPKAWPEDTPEAKNANRRVGLEFNKQ